MADHGGGSTARLFTNFTHVVVAGLLLMGVVTGHVKVATLAAIMVSEGLLPASIGVTSNALLIVHLVIRDENVLTHIVVHHRVHLLKALVHMRELIARARAIACMAAHHFLVHASAILGRRYVRFFISPTHLRLILARKLACRGNLNTILCVLLRNLVLH